MVQNNFYTLIDIIWNFWLTKLNLYKIDTKRNCTKMHYCLALSVKLKSRCPQYEKIMFKEQTEKNKNAPCINKNVL